VKKPTPVCEDAVIHRDRLAEAQIETARLVLDAFDSAKVHLRSAEAWLKSVPEPLMHNGALQARINMLRKLDDLDAHFVEAAKSLREQYGVLPIDYEERA
jgi:hypothetical protein